MQLLTIKDATYITRLSYSYLYEHKKKLGFFQHLNKGKWLVDKKVLEEKLKGRDNLHRLTSASEVKKCQSTDAVTSGILISNHQMEKELDTLLVRKIKKEP